MKMAKILKSTDFDKALATITAKGLAQAGAFLAAKCNERIKINNQDGWYRSLPGESPHHGASGYDKRVIWELVYSTAGALPKLVLGISKGNEHLLMLELGTKPHIITARRARVLRIPWRAEGRGRRQPTADEIKRLGLRPVGLVTRNARRGSGMRGAAMEWVYFVRSVKHPGTAPRPWLIPSIMENIKQIGRMFVGGADVSVNLAKLLAGANGVRQLRSKFEAFGGQMPIGPNRQENAGPSGLVPEYVIPRASVGPSGAIPPA